MYLRCSRIRSNQPAGSQKINSQIAYKPAVPVATACRCCRPDAEPKTKKMIGRHGATRQAQICADAITGRLFHHVVALWRKGT